MEFLFFFFASLFFSCMVCSLVLIVSLQCILFLKNSKFASKC